MSSSKKSRWGVGIAVLYGSFVLFILAIVAVASLQHFDLVEDHYYDKELVYQKHIDKINRTRALSERPTIRLDGPNRRVILSFPATMPRAQVSGEVVLYRPSGAVMDCSSAITLDSENKQQIPIDNFPVGFFRAKIDWRVGTNEYYLEESFYVP